LSDWRQRPSGSPPHWKKGQENKMSRPKMPDWVRKGIDEGRVVRVTRDTIADVLLKNLADRGELAAFEAELDATIDATKGMTPEQRRAYAEAELRKRPPMRF
jgi:hypothetical protein